MIRSNLILKCLSCLILGIALLSISGCDDSEAGIETAGKPGWPKELTYAFTSSSEDEVESRFEAYGELAEHLTNEIGIPVKIQRTLSYAPVIEAMRAGKVDIARAGSFSYMIAHEKAGVEPLATRGTSEGPGLYSSLFVTSPKTGIKTLEEMLERRRELTLAFVDPASTSGHLIPRAALQKMDVDAENEFKRVVFTMNHTNMAMTVLSAKVDVGAMSSSSYARLLQKGKIRPDDLVILWESRIIPQGPVMVRKELPTDLKEKIRQAYLKINDNPSLLAQLAKMSSKDELLYYSADDSMWDGLREIAGNVEGLDALGDW